MRNGRPKIPFEDKYVPEPNTGCWLWTSGWDSDGYGLMTGNVKAHRYSYEQTNGPIPFGLCVCHKCDTPACVNPSHLFLGTHKVNARDRQDKGRGAVGERSPHAKLSNENVAEILSSKDSKRILAKRFGVTRGAIGHVRKGRAWKGQVLKAAAQCGAFIPEPYKA